MPPRYAYWTILIDGKATAFRAREREELLPTFNQLARKNADIVMRYFARGRLWDNPEQAQWANRNREVPRSEPRDRDWRPGGEHKDPRARFERKPDRKSFDSKYRKPFASPERRPFQSKESKPLGERKPFSPGDRKPRFERRPNQPEHRGDRDERPKWHGKAPGKPFGKPRDESHGKPPDKRFQAKDWREPKAGAPPRKRPGNWSRPPKRKPR
jgi:hypothetical protein